MSKSMFGYTYSLDALGYCSLDVLFYCTCLLYTSPNTNASMPSDISFCINDPIAATIHISIKTVSYTHLDVYKRQTSFMFLGKYQPSGLSEYPLNPN